MFMNCPECRLKVRVVAPHMLLERCPRCLVRRRQIVEMRVTLAQAQESSLDTTTLRRGGHFQRL
jgi:hypothetical protein